jgi:hypothetical protein
MAIYSGFIHWKWWFSIAMLVYQRVPKKNAGVSSFFLLTLPWIRTPTHPRGWRGLFFPAMLQDASTPRPALHRERNISRWPGLAKHEERGRYRVAQRMLELSSVGFRPFGAEMVLKLGMIPKCTLNWTFLGRNIHNISGLCWEVLHSVTWILPKQTQWLGVQHALADSMPVAPGKLEEGLTKQDPGVIPAQSTKPVNLGWSPRGQQGTAPPFTAGCQDWCAMHRPSHCKDVLVTVRCWPQESVATISSWLLQGSPQLCKWVYMLIQI